LLNLPVNALLLAEKHLERTHPAGDMWNLIECCEPWSLLFQLDKGYMSSDSRQGGYSITHRRSFLCWYHALLPCNELSLVTPVLSCRGVAYPGRFGLRP